MNPLATLAATFRNIAHAAIEYARTLSRRERAGDRGVMEEVQVLQNWLLYVLLPVLMVQIGAAKPAAKRGGPEAREALAQLERTAQAMILLSLFLERRLKRRHLVRGNMLDDPATAPPRTHICESVHKPARLKSVTDPSSDPTGFT